MSNVNNMVPSSKERKGNSIGVLLHTIVRFGIRQFDRSRAKCRESLQYAKGEWKPQNFDGNELILLMSDYQNYLFVNEIKKKSQKISCACVITLNLIII